MASRVDICYVKRLRAAVLAALLVGASALAAVAIPGTAQAAPVICEQYGTASILNGQYIVQNNRWGGANTPQCIDVNQSGGFTVIRPTTMSPPTAHRPATRR